MDGACCVFVAGIHQDLLCPCDGMHVYTDYSSVYNLIGKSLGVAGGGGGGGGGVGVRTHVNFQGKIPTTGNSEKD